MSENKLKSILQENEGKIALVIGNGINRYRSSDGKNSWESLLSILAARHLPGQLPKNYSEISLTEFYDIIDIKSRITNPKKTLQEEFCGLLKDWTPKSQHKQIISWGIKNKSPILTTNFDRVMADAGDCDLYKTKTIGFTDYYPWETYYGNEQISDPSTAFGIWHVNGMVKYRRSIRLGLSHYMGSVEKARRWLHKGKEKRLFSGVDINDWVGASSWLKIIFNNPLIIFGLGLEINEVFLRWLLIERARYFSKFQKKWKPAWFVATKDLTGTGKLLFLEGVDIQFVKVDSYDDIYGKDIWGNDIH